MGIFAAIIFGMMSCLAPKIKNVTIDDLNWERTIDIEEVVTHNESDWSLPDDARLQYTKSEIQSYKDVLDHYETVTETKTRSVIDHYEEKMIPNLLVISGDTGITTKSRGLVAREEYKKAPHLRSEERRVGKEC